MAGKIAEGKKSERKRGRPPKSIINDKPSAEAMLDMYRQMVLIRRFEEKAGQLYGMGQIGGFCHLYIGQEAVVVGIQSVARPEDSVVTSYRDHGHMLACDMDAGGVMAELTGRADGYSRGKGGSMHMFSREKNFFGGHGIVAAQVPIGAGLAFAHKYNNDGGVNMAYLGDGAVNQGQVYETFNMAALWSLPVIFVIENNQYGMGTLSAVLLRVRSWQIEARRMAFLVCRLMAWMCWRFAPLLKKRWLTAVLAKGHIFWK